MTLALQSTDKALDAIIQNILSDSNVSLEEFRQVRDSADAAVNTLKQDAPTLVTSLDAFQSAADQLTDSLQKLALAIRKAKPDDAAFVVMKSAIEHQLAYVVLSYASSVERYSVLKTGVNQWADKANALKNGADKKAE
ncbi:hypothetical protein [Pseudomonas cremoricolorata]|uniref:Uncharacterized protein n=1 Tax=Pseudomonas cremoricolorata TaxID=157783 RepID=A0A089WN27_9PSED|nr:hypothetical protein [Pseudomonas cremoricolorata]AIR90655.1 hypothetical protein LK03_15855 [Pseudomonas cremoricolorata]